MPWEEQLPFTKRGSDWPWADTLGPFEQHSLINPSKPSEVSFCACPRDCPSPSDGRKQPGSIPWALCILPIRAEHIPLLPAHPSPKSWKTGSTPFISSLEPRGVYMSDLHETCPSLDQQWVTPVWSLGTWSLCGRRAGREHPRNSSRISHRLAQKDYRAQSAGTSLFTSPWLICLEKQSRNYIIQC